MFGPLKKKKALHGRRFASDDEGKERRDAYMTWILTDNFVSRGDLKAGELLHAVMRIGNAHLTFLVAKKLL